jgi:pyruvate/2-oxoglutarate dehydrogenase complex dihydrolipoamide acyltransferase (E2) component
VLALHKTVARFTAKPLMLARPWHSRPGFPGPEQRMANPTSRSHQEIRQPAALQHRHQHLCDARRPRRHGEEAGEDFVVYDAKTGEDITRSVLTQIIFEQENKEGAEPAADQFPAPADPLLRRQHADAGAALSRSVDRLAHPRAGEVPRADGAGLRRHRRLRRLEEQVRRNMEMFERAFAMFTPFARAQMTTCRSASTSSGDKDK